MSVSTLTDYSTSTVQQRAASSQSSSRDSIDFLTLLIAQLTNQDPLSPMEDIDFTSQLAQLQALEEQIALNETMATMLQDTKVQSATSMIGKDILGVDSNGNTVSGTVASVSQSGSDIYLVLNDGSKLLTDNVITISGGGEDSTLASELVHSQSCNCGYIPVICVLAKANFRRHWWPIVKKVQRRITRREREDIHNYKFDCVLAAAANVIGMFVDGGLNSAMQPVQGIVKEVSVTDGVVTLNLYGGESLTWNQVSSIRAPTDDESWYVLPDSVREKVELAQNMFGYAIDGEDESGNAISGVVGGAELDGHEVYLVLFDGTRVNIDTLTSTPRIPTAEDAQSSLIGLHATGLDEKGNTISGIITGAEDRDDGMVLILEDGSHVYYDALTTLTTEEDA